MLFCLPRAPLFLLLRRPTASALLGALWLALQALPTHAARAPLNPGQRLPPEVIKALVKAQVPPDAASFLVVDASGEHAPRLRHRIDQAMNPASVMKLVTTYAALDTLGPDFTWTTSVLADGAVSQDQLKGNLLLRGGGDPKLVVERLQALLGQVQASGVREVRGDIVLDRSTFAVPPSKPAEFDGEPLRPYNVQPDALLINFKSLVMTFTPDAMQGRATVKAEPPLAGVQVDAGVPLLRDVPCADWRSGLRASVDQPLRVQFQGAYPLACGERVWPTAYADPASFAARAVEGSWRLLGGGLTGTVRDATPAERAWQRGSSAPGPKPALRLDAPSLPLSDVVRDVNKFSNNVMAQHLLLTLGLQATPGSSAEAGSVQAGRDAVQAWWQKTLPTAPAPVVDNGSGLSRSERVSAASLGALLTHAQHSRWAALFTDTLPVAGVDATMRERLKNVAGQAFIKTGSLRDVSAVAGYAQSVGGRRYIVVGVVNHPQANAARPALDALIQWAIQQR